MEGDTHASAEDVGVMLSDNKVDAMTDGIERDISINTAHAQGKETSKEDYEIDGEFIKVEKEMGDVKETSRLQKHIEVEERPTNAVTGGSLLEAEDKIKSLELQLAMMSKELQHSESEKASLKSEVEMVKEQLEKVSRHREELELDWKRMKEDISATEEKYGLQLASFQEAQVALDAKNSEVGDVQESLSKVAAELENSSKRLQELEEELASSVSQTRELEKLSSDRSSHAELESKRASEMESMLELAKSREKDMEDQLTNFQEELKALYDRVSDNQQLEEVLGRCQSELSEVQEKLKLSESRVEELEQKFASKEDFIQELTQEVNLHKSYQGKMKEELLGLENMLSSSQDDIKSKIIELEAVESKLQLELKRREEVETSLNDQEMKMLSLQEELQKLTGEKENLLTTVADLNANLSLTKELCGQLEDKFLTADQNFSKTDALLTQALSYNAELELKLKSLEEVHGESKTVGETASQRNLELEGLLQSSSLAEEGLKEQLREKEIKLIATEQKTVELEEQLALAEVKVNDAEREIIVLKEKVSEFTVMLSKLEEDREISKGQLEEQKDMISQLESSLREADSRNLELVQEVKDLAEMRDTHEGRAAAAHQRLLKLEDLVQQSHFKAEDAGKKVEDLEFLLENTRKQIQNLEELLSTAETKYSNVEAESKQYSSKVSELSEELEALKAKSDSLEIMVQAANEKEKELTAMLNDTAEEKKKFEEMSKFSSEKLLQAESLIGELQSEIKSAQERLESIEQDIKVSGLRENELLEKLKSAEELLDHHGRTVEHASSRCLELESVHESFRKDSELKLQEVLNSLNLRDSEAKNLQENVMILEEQGANRQREVVEASEKVAFLKAELEASALKIFALENTVEELQGKLSDSERKFEQSIAENGLLAGTNSQLRSELEAHQSQVNELNELLCSIHAEKEATSEQLASHVKTIEELTNEHSRGLELNSATELRMKETELQLQEALEKFTQRDSESRGLNENLLSLEAQVRMYEEQLNEVMAVAEKQKADLEEDSLKVQNLKTALEEMESRANQFEKENEGLARTNMIQTEQLATYETKVIELEKLMNTAVADKEDAFLQLHSANKTIEDLRQQLDSDGEKLQSQIYSVMEENNTLNKMYQTSKEELQSVTVQLEEQKAREISICEDVGNLKTEIARMKLSAEEDAAAAVSKMEEYSNLLQEKDILNEQLKQLQKDLSLAHSTIAEQKELLSKVELETDAALKSSLVDVEAEHQRAILLERQVEELKQQLKLSETQYMEKIVAEGKKVELLNVELTNLKGKLSQNVELERKIQELQNKLENVKASMKNKEISVEEGSKSTVEVTSRDLGSGSSSTSMLKSTKGSEGAQSATEMIPVNPPSGLMAFKFILGVALVSVVIGIILGKKY